MRGIDAMKDAFIFKKPMERIPVWEIEFQLWDKFSGDHMVLGREYENLTYIEQERALHQNAEIISSVSNKLHFAAISVPGRFWQYAPGLPAYYWLPDDARLKQIKLIKEYCGDEYMLIAGSGGVMGMPSSSEYESFCYKLFDSPELIDERARNLYEAGIESAKKLINAGIDAVVTASDIADNRGVFYNREQMNRFILPYLQKWAQKVKDMGLFAILHSDGNLYQYINEIADSGINALQALDPLAGMDMIKVKEIVGDRICLCGNINCGILIDGTEESVIYDSTMKLLRYFRNRGGFILGVSNAVQTEVSTKSYLQIIRAYESDMFTSFEKEVNR